MTDEVMSPLRRRMIEDMTIRKLAPKTQQGYIRTIKDFAADLGTKSAQVRCGPMSGCPQSSQDILKLRIVIGVRPTAVTSGGERSSIGRRVLRRPW